jgi:hypothetical protein
MTVPEDDFDALVDALRSDLPSKSDERRVRRRLLAAGVGVTAGVVAPGASAGLVGGSSLPATLLQKLGALSWMTKVGLASVAVATALPAAVEWTGRERSEPMFKTAPAPRRVLPRSVSEVRPVLRLSPSTVRVPAEPPAPEPNGRHERASVEPVASPMLNPVAATDATEPSGRASSAAFPVDEVERARTESTLREETTLLERALYALRIGDRDDARRTLEEHARRFPNGLLARDRNRALERANAEEDPSSPAARP